MGEIILIIVGVIAVVLVLWIVLLYNKLVGLRNAIENTFNQIRVGMKKRLDMIGQLIDSTKSYIKYEKSIMLEVTKLRKMPVTTPEEISKADILTRGLFGRLLAVMENYPNLRGVEAVAKLQDSIKDIEDEIARQRYLYNDQVQSFNVTTQVFPNSLVAGLFGFGKKEYLRFEKEIEERPKAEVY